MKTLVKTPDSENIRRKVLKDQQKAMVNTKKASDEFRLKKNDYDELIRIKRARDQKQKDRSVLFFFVGLCITLGSLIVVFNWNFRDDKGLMQLGTLDNENFEEIHEIPNTEQPPPPPPQVIQQPVIVEVPDEVILEEVDVNLDVEITEDMVIQEVEFAEAEDEEVVEEIFEIVENAPEPKGGYKAFYSYIAENLKYPRHALKLDISGRVFVMFVVDKDGSLTDVHSIKGIGGGCDEEAVRVVKSAPKWQPGKQRGRAVKVRMTLPITFRITKN